MTGTRVSHYTTIPASEGNPASCVKVGGNGNMSLLSDQNNIYKFITLLPKDYCLIPGNGAIKLVGIRTITHLTIFITNKF